MLPDLVTYQVQYLVAFITGLVGKLVGYLADAVSTFGGDVVTAAGNSDQMQALTTGIFGDQNGLIYWINEKVFFVLRELPYSEIGLGLKAILTAMF